MSDTTLSQEELSEEISDGPANDDHHDGPTEKQYWIVFAILAAFTAVEVAWTYIGVSGIALVLPLVLMMITKFLLVTGVFMHLYFDFKIVNGKYFAMTFGGALFLALLVYMIVFASFEFEFSYFE
jgi:cytochrome c oxidase subunit IV